MNKAKTLRTIFSLEPVDSSWQVYMHGILVGLIYYSNLTHDEIVEIGKKLEEEK